MGEPVDAAQLLARLNEELRRPPFHHWLRPEALGVDAAAQAVEVGLRFRPELGHTAGRPAFHGGVIGALADITGHAAVAVWCGHAVPTISLLVDYVRPAEGELLVARGVLRRLGRAVGRADVEMTIDNRLVALGRGTFSIAGG